MGVGGGLNLFCAVDPFSTECISLQKIKGLEIPRKLPGNSHNMCFFMNTLSKISTAGQVTQNFQSCNSINIIGKYLFSVDDEVTGSANTTVVCFLHL